MKNTKRIAECRRTRAAWSEWCSADARLATALNIRNQDIIDRLVVSGMSAERFMQLLDQLLPSSAEAQARKRNLIEEMNAAECCLECGADAMPSRSPPACRRCDEKSCD